MSTIDTIGGTAEARNLSTPNLNGRFSITRLSQVFAWLIERRRTRIQLLELTDDQLKDIGLSRADAYREGSRSFFDRMPATGARSWFGQ